MACGLRTTGIKAVIGMASKRHLLRVPSTALLLLPPRLSGSELYDAGTHECLGPHALASCLALCQHSRELGYPVASLLLCPLKVYLKLVFQLQST